MRRLFFALILLIPVILTAQDDKRYLLGAVPEENGKVVFDRTIEVPGSQSEIYSRISNWIETQYREDGNKVLYANREQGDIAAQGETTLVFSSTALSYDRTIMWYRLVAKCDAGSCKLTISSIRYRYNKETVIYNAEDWITDREALNKSKNGLNRANAKFRTHTIDFVESVFAAAAKALDAPTSAQAANPKLITSQTAPVSAGKVHEDAPTQVDPNPMTSHTATVSQGKTSETAAAAKVIPAAKLEPAQEGKKVVNPTISTDGFIAFGIKGVPEVIIEMLPESQLTAITGTSSDKNIRFAEISKAASTIAVTTTADSDLCKTVDKGGQYIITFSKKGNSEPWMIVQCVKKGETKDGKSNMVTGDITAIYIK